MGPRGSMLHAPDVYMDKLAIGPGYRKDAVTLDMTPAERVHALARAKGTGPSGIMVCVLERPRHEELIAEIRATGARIRLIPDGDVAGVIHCADPDRPASTCTWARAARRRACSRRRRSSAWAGRCMGRLLFRNDDEKQARQGAGIADLDKVYSRDEMVTEDVIFAATGVTDGSIVKGARRDGEWIETETILMRSKTGSVRRLHYRRATSSGGSAPGPREGDRDRLHGGLDGALGRRNGGGRLEPRRVGPGGRAGAGGLHGRLAGGGRRSGSCRRDGGS